MLSDAWFDAAMFVASLGFMPLLIWLGRRHGIADFRGWRLIIAGSWLFVAATGLQLTMHFPELDGLVVVGDGWFAQVVLKLGVGFGLGTALSVVGMWQWVPVIGELRKARIELHEANARLTEVDALRKRFLSTASHELNTPLTPIRVQFHLLNTGRLGPLNEQQQRALRIADRNLTRLTVLVADLLDAARLQNSHLVLKRCPTDLGGLAQQSVETFAEQAKLQGVTLVADAPLGIVADIDAARVEQVLINLLSNALKFTPAGGHVELTTRVEGDAAEVEVRDTGRGLTHEQITRLFQPFTQVHDGADARGSGLGLYISRGLIEAMGGAMWAASEGPGRGAVFGVRLPLARAPAPAPTVAAPPLVPVPPMPAPPAPTRF